MSVLVSAASALSMSTSSATAAVEDNVGRDALTPNERLGGVDGCVEHVRNCFLDEATQDDALLLA